MRNLIRCFSLVMVLIFTLNSNVLATPSQSQNYENIEMAIEKLDVEIEETLHKIEVNKNDISKTEVEITATEKEMKKAQDKMDKEQNLYKSRIRAIYISGLDSYLSILLSADGLGDFISKVEAVNQIITYDNNLIARFKNEKNNLNNKKEQLLSKRNNIVAIKKDNEEKLAMLNSDKEAQKKLIVQAGYLEGAYRYQYSGQVNIALKDIDNIRKTVPKINVSRGAAAISDNSVIAYASNYLGTPYVWGGTSPNPGFDCSGFTQYVYRHFGIYLGRTTFDQIKNGYAVSRENLQPGDLVFFGTYSNPHHMGIYVGNNSYIHAPRTGDVVKVSPLSRADYLTARRVK